MRLARRLRAAWAAPPPAPGAGAGGCCAHSLRSLEPTSALCLLLLLLLLLSRGPAGLPPSGLRAGGGSGGGGGGVGAAAVVPCRAHEPAPYAALLHGTGRASAPVDAVLAARALAAWQSPANCSDAAFLEVRCEACGLGCTLNTLALGLGEARRRGRVMLPSTACGGWLELGGGGDAAPAAGGCADAAPEALAPLECLVQRLTACPRGAATPDRTLAADWAALRALQRVPDGELATGDVAREAAFRALAPAGADAQWWAHAMALAYVARPAQPVLDAVLGVRDSPGAALTALRPPPPHAAGAAASPPPRDGFAAELPRAVSVFVRHGDKALETRLVDTAAYLERAVPLARALAPGAPTVLFASDDQAAVDAAARALAADGVRMLVESGLPRTAANPGTHFDEAQAQLGGMPMSALLRAQFVDMLRAAAAGAWVGTLESNICRVVNALRCAWDLGGGRAAVFTDLRTQGGKGEGLPPAAGADVAAVDVPCWLGPVLTRR